MTNAEREVNRKLRILNRAGSRRRRTRSDTT